MYMTRFCLLLFIVLLWSKQALSVDNQHDERADAPIDSIMAIFAEGNTRDIDAFFAIIMTHPITIWPKTISEKVFLHLLEVVGQNNKFYSYRSRIYFAYGLYLMVENRREEGFNYFQKATQEPAKNKQDSINRFYGLVPVTQMFLGANEIEATIRYGYWAKRFIPTNSYELLGRSVLNLFNNLGIAHARKGNTDLALGFYNLGKNIAEKQNDTAWIGIFSGNMGDIFLGKGNDKAALLYLKRDIDISLLFNETASAINAIHTLTEVHQKKGNSEAVDSLVAIMENLINTKNFLDLGQIIYPLEFLQSYFEERKQLEQSLYYAKLSLRSMSILSRRVDAGSFSKTILSGELNQKEMYNKLLKEKNEQIAKASSLRLQVLFVLCIVFAILVLIFEAYRKRNKELKLVNKKLDEKTADLSISNERLEQSQAALNDKNNQLQALLVTKDKLFSVLAHDLRSPLINLSELLRLHEEGMLNEQELRENLSILSGYSRELNDSLDNILHWINSQLSGIQTVTTRINLQKSVLEVQKFYRLSLSKKQLNFKFLISGGVFVLADENQIKTVLRNLISNAIKFSEPKGTIGVKLIEKNQHILVEVTDSGKGLNEEQQEKINQNIAFTSFGTKGERGSGIGLMLCKTFLKQNKSELMLKSQENVGSTFSFQLPKAYDN